MSIILYCGSRLDSTLPDRPVVVRGYDTAGNQLMTVRAGERITPIQSYIDDYNKIVFDCLDRYGQTIRVKRNVNAVRELTGGTVVTRYPSSFTPKRVVMRQDGYLFCAADALGMQTQRIDGGTTIAWDTISYALGTAPSFTGPLARGFMDYFRVYHLTTGRQVPFPDLHGGEIWDIALDPSDWSIYVCGEPVGANEYIFRKYDSTGALIWSYGNDRIRLLGNRLKANGIQVALAPDGSVYLHGIIYAEYPAPDDPDAYETIGGYAGAPQGQSWIARIDPDDGAEIWNRSMSQENLHGDGNGYYNFLKLNGFSVGDNGYLYTSGAITGYHTPGTSGDGEWIDVSQSAHAIHRWNPTTGEPDATVLSYVPQNARWRGGALHTLGAYIPAGEDEETYETYRKYDASLNYISGAAGFFDDYGSYEYLDRRELDHLYEVTPEGQIVEAVRQYGASGTRDIFNFWAHDAAMTRKWSALSATASDGVDYSGNVRASAEYLSTVYQTISGDDAGPDYGLQDSPYTNFGREFWSLHPAVYHSKAPAQPISICASPLLPALPIRLELGLPGWIGDTYTQCPPLALRLALGLPALRREYAGALRLPDVYRATLGALSLAIRTINIRRGADGAVALTLTVPLSESVTIPALLALDGALLTLYRGVRFLDGAEQLEPMVAVTLASIRADAGARSGTATLSGSAVEITRPPLTRALRGISYRASGSGGARVRCAVDTYLRPGDTADLGGGETMPVVEVTCSISAESAVMEVA